MKTGLKIFFVILSIMMFLWLLKILVAGSEVLGYEYRWDVPCIYFFVLFYFYIGEKNNEIKGLKYDIEYWKKKYFEKYSENKEEIWKI